MGADKSNVAMMSCVVVGVVASAASMPARATVRSDRCRALHTSHTAAASDATDVTVGAIFTRGHLHMNQQSMEPPWKSNRRVMWIKTESIVRVSKSCRVSSLL